MIDPAAFYDKDNTLWMVYGSYSGGIFILGLDLAAYGQDQPDEEVWTARKGGKTFRHVMMTLPPLIRPRPPPILPQGRTHR